MVKSLIQRIKIVRSLIQRIKIVRSLIQRIKIVRSLIQRIKIVRSLIHATHVLHFTNGEIFDSFINQFTSQIQKPKQDGTKNKPNITKIK